MTMTKIDQPPLGHAEAMRLAATEYQRLVELLESLSDSDWRRPTECSPWSVRDLATHLLGYMRVSASPREQVRQVRAAKRRGGPVADAMSALQVEELAGLTPGQVLDEIRALAPAAVRGRTRIPSPVRRYARITADLPVSGTQERWTLGYLVDVIATRDGWMHRNDISRAVGRPPVLTAAHDGRLIADVVAEWARRHGQPVDLQLTGPAGGTFRQGAGGPTLTYDAIDFCRLSSGRDGEPVLGTEVPF